MNPLPAFVTAALLLTASIHGADDFVPLFNGKDLSGWVPVNVHPETFTVRDGMIISTGKPTGVMRTEKQYENFELELEYRHMVPQGNAGLFVWSDPLTSRGVPFTRAIEVQILDGRNGENYSSHGDVFSIHGARMTPHNPHPNGWERCLPSEKRAKPAGEWNHYRVVCNNGDVKLAVNGKVVSGGSNCTPRKGYICLEAEGSECHFRNIKIKELPSTNPRPEEIASVADTGFKLIYNGINLDGWKVTPDHEGHWQVKDWTLAYDGKATGSDPHLWTKKSYKDFVLICDWRFPARGTSMKRPVILRNGEPAKNADGTPREMEIRDAGDSGIYLRGNDKSQVNIWCWPVGSGEVYGYRTDPNMTPEIRAGVTPKENADRRIGEWNRFIITMKGDRLTVNLNGTDVITNAQLPGIPSEGPIALQHHGDPIEFANIYIKELAR